MRKHILVGATLLLTLGTAVAGTFIYGGGSDSALNTYESTATRIAQEPTPATIDMWKATAASANYIAPKVPI